MTAVNLSGSPVSTISPYAHVYQPLVENTRPHSVNGYNNVYESLRGVRDIQELRSFSYSVYQDLSRGSRVTSSGSNYQTMFAPVELTARDPVNSSSACNYADVPTAALDAQCDLKTARDTLKRQSETESLDDKECAMDETSGNSLTDRCQSISASTLQNEEREEGAVGIEFRIARSSSSLSLSSLKFYEEDDISVDNDEKEMTSDSIVNVVLSEEHQQQDETIDISDKTFAECDTPRDDLREGTSDCRLSGLEIMIDSDCSEYDSALEEVIDETETQSPSQRFYYVLEGP